MLMLLTGTILATIICEIKDHSTDLLIDTIIYNFGDGINGLNKNAELRERISKKIIEIKVDDDHGLYQKRFLEETIIFIKKFDQLKKNNVGINLKGNVNLIKNQGVGFKDNFNLILSDWDLILKYFGEGSVADLSITFLFLYLVNDLSLKEPGVDNEILAIVQAAIRRQSLKGWQKHLNVNYFGQYTLCAIEISKHKSISPEKGLSDLNKVFVESKIHPSFMFSIKLDIEIRQLLVKAKYGEIIELFKEKLPELVKEFPVNNQQNYHICKIGEWVATSILEKNMVIESELDGLRVIFKRIIENTQVLEGKILEAYRSFIYQFRQVCIKSNSLEKMRGCEGSFSFVGNVRPFPRQDGETLVNFFPPMEVEPQLLSAAAFCIDSLDSFEKFKHLGGFRNSLQFICQDNNGKGLVNSSCSFLIEMASKDLARLAEIQKFPDLYKATADVFNKQNQVSFHFLNNIESLDEFQKILNENNERRKNLKNLFGENSFIETFLTFKFYERLLVSIPFEFLELNKLINTESLLKELNLQHNSKWENNYWFQKEKTKILFFAKLKENKDQQKLEILLSDFIQFKQLSCEKDWAGDPEITYFQIATCFKQGKYDDCRKTLEQASKTLERYVVNSEKNVQYMFKILRFKLTLDLENSKTSFEYLKTATSCLRLLKILNSPKSKIQAKLFDEYFSILKNYYLSIQDFEGLKGINAFRIEYFNGK